MSAVKIEGIVLDSIDYDDFAKIVKVFSKQFGILSFFAPGVNKEGSKNKYSVQNLTCSEFEIFKARKDEKVSKLKTGRLIVDFYAIATNYNNYVFVSILVNLLTQLLPPGFKAVNIYYAFKTVLENMKAKRNGFLNYAIFLLYFIQNSEYRLRTNRCSRCKKTTNSYARFEYTDKTLVCVKCLWPGEKNNHHHLWKFLVVLMNLILPN
ncbi:DNA repair protein recO [Spiroplasma clarkii]|uniref:DNA repair protein RecO n=1 Tax=Spiroplasma clarkii TaxID=2139 RepID=UPI000B5641B0|nr:DNA repair protein RecO [Spiroplasma clarkii]ARU91455.1 DNA repair protein recO [Spiroplasma clarkii]